MGLFDKIFGNKEPSLLPNHCFNWLLSIVLIALLANSWGHVQDQDICAFDANSGNCQQPFGCGVASLIFSTVFILLHCCWGSVENHHRIIYLIESILGLIVTVAFFAYFIRLTTAWGNTSHEMKDNFGHDVPQLAISTCFFLFLGWLGLTWFAFQGYKGDNIGGS
jgi:hypothetical protein